MKKNKFIASIVLCFPAVASAQLLTSDDSVRSLSTLGLDIVYYLMQTLFALISLGIIYLTFKYVDGLRQGSKDATKYRELLIGAIIGLAVVFSMWGIIELLTNTLGWTDFGIPVLTAPKA